MSVTPGGALAGPWVKNSLWRTARAVPSLDLPFADTKSLADAVTGQSLVAFTRASSGTYVGSDGLIKTATTNLLLQSEDFGTTWTRNAGLQFTANQTMAPNGLTTADLLAGDGTQIGYVEQPTSSSNQFVSGLSYTFSVYLKKANTSTVLTLLYGLTFNSGGSSPIATWNLDTGVPSFSNGCTGSMTAVGNGWYRCVVTDTATATETRNQQWLRMPVNAGDVYAWGAQLEQSSTVGEYIPTTSTINSAPRFDHNPTTGESLGLLVEEQRTNSVTNNTMVGAVAGTPGTLPTGWGIFISPTGLTRTIVGSGTVNGINYIDVRFSGTPSSTGEITLYLSPVTTATLAQAWVSTVWLSLAGGSISNIAGINLRNFEINSGAYVREVNANFVSSISSDLVRRQLITTSFGASANQIQLVLTLFAAAAGTPIDITLRIGMPQLEQGAFATSVIPTTGAAATRSADVASITGSNFGTTRTNLLVRSEEFDNASWVKLNNVTVTANATTAPNGFITADKIVEPASSADKPIVQSVTLIANTTYTASVYFKAAERPTILFHVRKNDYSTRFGGFFNTSTNVFTTDTSGGGVLDSFTFTNVGGNWYRCSITGNIGANTAGIVTVYLANSSNNLTYTGDGTSGLFLWGAQLEVGAAVTPYIQSPSVFVSRASSGTYIGGNGVLQTATTNLQINSENIASLGTLLGSTVTSNATVAPDGQTTADKLIEDTSTGGHQVSGTTISWLGNTTYTVSVYAKSDTRTFLTVAFGTSSNWVNSSRTATFNLSTGTISSQSGTPLVASIQTLPNGWYRCSISATTIATPVASSLVLQLNNGSTTSYTGDGISGLFLWGVQLEQSSTVGEYIPTTSTINSAARYDHNPISLIGKGLLLEEARTNLLLQSADISNIYWVKSETTVTANAITAPDGTTTAGKLVESINNTQHTLASAVISWAGNTQYTATFFAKAGERSKFDILLGTAANWVNSERVATFDLANGTVYFSPNSPAVASITPFANNWFRCRITATTTATPSASSVFIRMCDNTGLASYQGIANYGIYLWGAQLEAGAFPTSYIPTTTATVTRAADVSTSVATSVFESSWYRQDEGTVFAEVANARGTGPTFTVRATTTPSERMQFVNASGQTAVIAGGVAQVLFGGNTARQSFAYRANDFAQQRLGASLETDVNGSVPTVDYATIGRFDFGGADVINGTIRRLTYWPARLPNSTIQALTQ